MRVTQFRAPRSPQRPPPAPQHPELWPVWLPRRGVRPGFPRGAARAPEAAASTRQAPPPERPFFSLPPQTRLWSRLPNPGLPGPSEFSGCCRCPWKTWTCSPQPLPGDLRPVLFLPEPRVGRECGQLWEAQRLQLELLGAFLSGSYFLLV